MKRKIFKRLITIQEAIEIVRRSFIRPNRTLDLKIEDSIGKICAECIYSDMDVPHYSKSDVDGYAVKSEDVSEAC